MSNVDLAMDSSPESVPLQTQTQNQGCFLDLVTDTISEKDTETHKVPRSKWKPGAFRRFPLFGIIPLILSIACEPPVSLPYANVALRVALSETVFTNYTTLPLGTATAVAIILLSEGTPVDGWWSGVRQPGVLLAYTSTIANTLMGIAFAEGAIVFFWTRAVMGKMQVSVFVPVNQTLFTTRYCIHAARHCTYFHARTFRAVTCTTIG